MVLEECWRMKTHLGSLETGRISQQIMCDQMVQTSKVFSEGTLDATPPQRATYKAWCT